MKLRTCILLSLGCSLLLASCELFYSSYKYNSGTFPDRPINLEAINSAEDDYNSDIPTFINVAGLVFSSKRKGGGQFDFVNEWLNYQFDRRTGKFTVENQPYGNWDAVERQRPLAWAAEAANSPANELGPYIRTYDPFEGSLNTSTNEYHYGEYLMLFASDRTGNLDIYLTHNYRPGQTRPTSTTNTSQLTGKVFSQPVPVPFLNSPADDAYPTLDKAFGTVYFTSNRGGSFDIYRATLPAPVPVRLHEQLPALKETPIERVAELSSTADDKCPYIQGDRLVFTSNRPGGYGGYDLYYSQWEGGRWSAPVNFGPAINSAADEYRPILRTDWQYTNQLLLFSSNRPGGKGGFDLYMVGVPK